MAQKNITAEVRLYEKIDIMPNEGLEIHEIRVELCKKGQEEGWIALGFKDKNVKLMFVLCRMNLVVIY